MDTFRIPTLALAAVLIWQSAAAAATFIVPHDETLIADAEVIVTGTILGSYSQFTEDGSIETIHRLALDETLKGAVSGRIIEFREWGGTVDGHWMVASGAPRYEQDRRYLILLGSFRDGRLTTHELSLGRFEFDRVRGDDVLVRDLGDSQILGPKGRPVRPAGDFLAAIRKAIGQSRGTMAVRKTVTPFANDLDTRAAAVKGATQWSVGSSVNYLIGSSPATGNTKGNDGEERILIDDPNDDIVGSFGGSGTIAIAFFGGTTAGFTDRINLTYSDIVVQDGVSTAAGVTQEEYATVLTHELGHTLGFRHANQNKFSQSGSTCTAPLPCSPVAIMNSFIISGFDGTLQSWDKSALQANYGSAPNGDYLIISESSLRPWYRTNTNVVWRIFGGSSSCKGPVITSGPVAMPSAIQSGQTSQLSVSAVASQGSLQFQWYRGASGDTGSPIPGGTDNTITVSPGQTSSYWVRLTDGCGSFDSASLQVTVAVCEPVITQPPQNRLIGPGESTTLVVAAANATNYNWYRGASGNTATFEGSGQALVVSPSQTTSYWVRVGNSCGSIDSASVTVQVLQCPLPVITEQPRDIDIQANESATLQVVASGEGTLRYEWYRGESGDTSVAVGEDSNVFVTAPLQTSTSYWVRVHGACGFRDSRTARIRIVTTCLQPTIEVQPADRVILRGTGTTLTVEATGTSLRYQWHSLQGAHGAEIKGATGPTLETGPIDSSRIFYARIQNSCGAISTRQVLVEVVDLDGSRRRSVGRPGGSD